MHGSTSHRETHEHVFLGAQHLRNERRTWLVIALTTLMMVAEIIAGTVYGSMALVADGWHMSTHAAAMLISALAYLYARRHAHDPRFTFGTGKLGDLAAFASAVLLALIALVIGWESLLRLAAPVPIRFGDAIVVAVIGLGVNLLSAWLLREEHGHDHGHGHHAHSHHHHDHPHKDGDHGHEHHDHEHHGHRHHDGADDHRAAHAGRPSVGASGNDNNLRAAYLHVLADALTSVLAIAALAAGSSFGWLWTDPLIGLLGALVIARWSVSLIREAGAVLVDFVPAGDDLPDAIRAAIETEGDRITDLHVWRVGPGHHAAIVAVATASPTTPDHYKHRLAHLRGLSHLTVEVDAPARLAA